MRKVMIELRIGLTAGDLHALSDEMRPSFAKTPRLFLDRLSRLLAAVPR